jgi:hypothetical protein
MHEYKYHLNLDIYYYIVYLDVVNGTSTIQMIYRVVIGPLLLGGEHEEDHESCSCGKHDLFDHAFHVIDSICSVAQ